MDEKGGIFFVGSEGDERYRRKGGAVHIDLGAGLGTVSGGLSRGGKKMRNIFFFQRNRS